MNGDVAEKLSSACALSTTYDGHSTTSLTLTAMFVDTPP